MWLKIVAAYLAAMCVITSSLVCWLEQPDQFLHVVMCDVGQGDGILIFSGFTQVLIDAGPDDKILSCLQRYLPFWDHNLEVMIATHSDHDHIGGMPAVFDHYQIGSLLLTAQVKENDDFRYFRQSVLKIRKKGTHLLGARVGESFKLTSQTIMTVISPEGDQAIDKLYLQPLTEPQLSAYLSQEAPKYIDANDGSIVVLLQFGHFTFLSTGDMEEPSEKTLSIHHLIKDVDVLKAGHHGSKTSSTAAFLAETRPEFTLISSGQGNSYGHPHTEVLRRLEEVGSQILRTDQLGSIELQTDGQCYWFFHSN